MCLPAWSCLHNNKWRQADLRQGQSAPQANPERPPEAGEAPGHYNGLRQGTGLARYGLRQWQASAQPLLVMDAPPINGQQGVLPVEGAGAGPGVSDRPLSRATSPSAPPVGAQALEAVDEIQILRQELGQVKDMMARH